MICVTRSQITDPMAKAEAEAPSLLHGDIERKPRPVPAVTNIVDTAAAMTAPAMTAPHRTAEREDSVPPAYSARAMMDSVFCMTFPFLIDVTYVRNQCQSSAIKIMMGIGTPNSHKSMDRMMSP